MEQVRMTLGLQDSLEHSTVTQTLLPLDMR